MGRPMAFDMTVGMSSQCMIEHALLQCMRPLVNACKHADDNETLTASARRQRKPLRRPKTTTINPFLKLKTTTKNHPGGVQYGNTLMKRSISKIPEIGKFFPGVL